MLWTVFMFFMFVWMLGLVLEFQLGAIPLVIVLTTILAFIKVLRAPHPIAAVDFRSGSSNDEAEHRSTRRLLKVISTREVKCLKSH